MEFKRTQAALVYKPQMLHKKTKRKNVRKLATKSEKLDSHRNLSDACKAQIQSQIQ